MQRLNQRERILELLRSHDGAWVPLPEILALHIAQYAARIFELRRAGYQIENRQEGEHSWFRLLPEKSFLRKGSSEPAHAPKPVQSEQGELFTPAHRDLG
jgi:hypothetical protein